MKEYSEEQIKYHQKRWDPQGIHLLRGETIERMKSAGMEPEEPDNEDENIKSVAVQFAEILEKHAKRVRSTENQILLRIKANGFSTIFEELIEKIVKECKDEHLLDQDGDG
jgi:sugar-specific transcriptional regulator TrmB